jgi:hypothetical protein
MPLSTADELAITQLASRYNHSIDHKEAEAWADCFAEDGVLRVNGRVIAGGRAALLAYIRAKGADCATRHWTNNAVIDGDGDAARLRLYVKTYNVVGGALGAPYMLGEYDDTLVKLNGRWKFKLRDMRVVAGKSRTDAL